MVFKKSGRMLKKQEANWQKIENYIGGKQIFKLENIVSEFFKWVVK